MKNLLFNFKEATDKEGLKLIQINTEGNDYPRGLGSYGAIGFDTYEDAEKFAEENGGEVYIFETRAGHTFWRAKGNKYEALTAQDYINDCNDNVNVVCIESETEHFWEAVKETQENEDFESLLKIIDKQKEAIDFFENLPEDETPIYDGNCDSYESVPNTMMHYSEDVYTYAVGVYFNPELHEE